MRRTAPEIEKAVVDDYQAGVSAYEIPRKYGISRSVVYLILERHGVKRRPPGATFRDGRTMRDGYVLINVAHSDEMAKLMANGNANGRYVLEHRIVMARHLGRPLHSHESVHHINGDKADNRLENLQLRIGPHGKHQAFRCLDCGSTNVEPVTLN